MSNDNSQLNHLVTRVRQMILQYKAIKKENDDLYSLVDERDKEIARQKEEIARLKNDYETLKLVKMMTVTDGDVETTRKRVNQLIRDVNQCITLLSEK